MVSLRRLSILKPMIPRRLQISIRRAITTWKMPTCRHVWPIDPHSAAAPEGWPGWPEGKKFALVLTHDVDTHRGRDKVDLLSEIEEYIGFRSSFNFVAEDYQIPQELIDKLTSKGFEIGQHGIHHRDPFRSKRHFRKQAVKINHYLKKWNAVGFRGPSMYRNLDWVHDLNIEYDASTFDTDPFEPQPGGMGTIFPFWVPGNGIQRGYVELPYTIPQDFLLFVIMNQKNTDIWRKKIEWIVANGGIALFITHPDYMNFNTRLDYEEYPARYYVDFLKNIKSEYEGQYWHVLPRDLARWWAGRYRKQLSGHTEVSPA